MTTQRKSNVETPGSQTLSHLCLSSASHLITCLAKGQRALTTAQSIDLVPCGCSCSCCCRCCCCCGSLNRCIEERKLRVQLMSQRSKSDPSLISLSSESQLISDTPRFHCGALDSLGVVQASQCWQISVPPSEI